MRDEKLIKISVIVGILLSATLLVNTLLDTYLLYTDNFKASIAETGESLEVGIRGDTGRPRGIWGHIQHYVRSRGLVSSWIGAWIVDGQTRENAITGIEITVTGTNVASTASVTYYIEGVPQSGGHSYRFLEANQTSVTLGNTLDLENQTSIEAHLQAMGLNTTSSHTIDYYVYVKAEATGAVSGETITSEITRTKFDTVEYQYGVEVTDALDASTTWTYKDDDHAWQDLYEMRVTRDTYTSAMVYNITEYTDKNVVDAALWIYVEEGASDDNLEDTGPLVFSRCTETPGSQHSHENPPNTTSSHQFTAWMNFMQGAWLIEHDNVLEQYEDESGDELAILIQMSSSSDYSQWTATGNGGISQRHPELRLTYITYSSSWYTIPPLSVVNLPISLDLVAAISAIIAAAVAVKTRKEENKRR